MITTAARLDHLEMTMIRRFVSAAPANALNLGLGQTNEQVPECVQQALLAPGVLSTAGYGANAGTAELRERIAARYKVDVERVLVTAGVQEAVFLVMMGLLEPGDRVLVPDPGFPVYATIARMFGAIPVPYTLAKAEGFAPTASCLERAIEETAPALVVVCSPGNPTGAVAMASEWQAIGELCTLRGVPVLSDEIYLPFQNTGRQEHGTLLKHATEAIVASGLSKTHGMAGWRLGWLVLPAVVAPKLIALHQHVMTSASTLVQQAALGAFTPEGDDSVDALRVCLAEKQALAVSRLEAAGCEVAAQGGAFYLWVGHPSWASGLELATSLRDVAGVVTIPGVAFGTAGEPYVRISYSVPMETLETALDRLSTFFEER